MFKNKFSLRNVVAIAACLAVSTVFLGCGSDDTPKDKDEDKEKTGALIAGKFASQTGTGDAVFYADYVSTTRAASTEEELTGKIEDGDIVFNLKGVYNTSDSTFFLSAGSSFLIYQIAGTLTDGGLTATEAAVKIKSGNEWTLHVVAVTSTEKKEIDADADTEQEEGIPSKFFGTWNLKFDKTGEGYEDQTIVVTPYQWVNTEYPDAPAGLIDISVDASGKNYSMVFQSVVRNESDEGSYDPQPVESKVWYTTEYIKITAQVSGEQLKIKFYWDSSSEDYATTKAFDTATANPSRIDTSTMTRSN